MINTIDEIDVYDPNDDTLALELWNVHSKPSDEKVNLRKTIHNLGIVERENYNPGVHKAGWNGYYQVEGFGVTAFVKRQPDESDGTLVFDW